MYALKTNKDGYNELYKDIVSKLILSRSNEYYIKRFRRISLSPFYRSGNTKGYVWGLTIEALFREVANRRMAPEEVDIWDAG